jgi:subtilisin family serine protease
MGPAGYRSSRRLGSRIHRQRSPRRGRRRGNYDAHQDLKDNIDRTVSTSFVPGFAFNQDVDGPNWHGTQVAGVIASASNGVGIVGVAPQATIIGVKVLHGNAGAFGDVLAGILYAATPVGEGGAGADIINLSIGLAFYKGSGPTGAGPLVAQVNQAVNYAVSRGVLVVAAAGNDRVDLDHTSSYIVVPAMSASTVAVSATGPVGYAVGYPFGANNYRRPASYTNYGNSLVNFAAPGGDFVLPPPINDCSIPAFPSGFVTAACAYFDLVISTDHGSPASPDSYVLTAGTSLSAPFVSGVAALLKQRYPQMTGADLKAKLAATADDEGKEGHDPYYGRGFINARRAVTE